MHPEVIIIISRRIEVDEIALICLILKGSFGCFGRFVTVVGFTCLICVSLLRVFQMGLRLLRYWWFIKCFMLIFLRYVQC